jgi:hypothetical protein
MLHRATVERRLRVTCHIAHDPDPAAHSRQLADRGGWRRRVQGYLNKRRWEQKITSAIPLCRARDSNPDPKSRRASNSLTARAAPVQGSLAIGHLGFDGGVVAPPSEEAILCHYGAARIAAGSGFGLLRAAPERLWLPVVLDRRLERLREVASALD